MQRLKFNYSAVTSKLSSEASSIGGVDHWRYVFGKAGEEQQTSVGKDIEN